MDRNNIIESGGFYFIHNFDSGNLGHVERVPTELISPTVNLKTNTSETPDYEFNLWTRPDCAGTEFENGNRTWFYFGIQAAEPNVQVRLNIINLNKQGKMYNQGMAPVTRTLPGKPQWERIRDRPVHSTDDNTFTISFKYKTSENSKATTFFAFTYPFSFAELQIALNSIDLKMLPLPSPQSPDDIYYYRECLIYSLEGRRVDLLTISSHHGITTEREHRLKNLFPDNQERPHKFQNKKIIFMSARVHPGETPSSFVFNGFLNMLLTRHDSIAMHLRKLYVFKMVPFLNPDGVARGHYRTDTRGVNLNRVYLNPTLMHHPTVYAARSLIRYYHYGSEKEEDIFDDSKSLMSRSIGNISESVEFVETKKKRNALKGSEYKREKTSSFKSPARKSFTSINRTSNDASKDAQTLSGEAAHLADQVHEMKLQEMPSQTHEGMSGVESIAVLEETPSLLNDSVLRSCLGSTVHLSTSEELNMHGGNPLEPLRQTLKDSISLLMESNSSVVGDSSTREAKVKMGWCSECQRAISRLEDTMPGIANMVPGYSAMMLADVPKYSSIDEYREHQRQQVDAQERVLQDTECPSDAAVYFCTNCFKRYVISDCNEEIKLSEALSCTSVGVSVCIGDSGDVCAPIAPTDDVIVRQNPPLKEEKSKSPMKSVKKKTQPVPVAVAPKTTYKEPESGLYLYIDLHGHASKKGIFMYGNHFDDVDNSVECMLLPRIMSLNNLHFHFSSCNFTERNMYLKDRRDGMSREGSGRVAVLKATGLVRSYTLECNYNTGRLVNVLPPAVRDTPLPTAASAGMPPKYTPHIFEEIRLRAKTWDPFEEIDPMKVGRSLGASILDLTGQHPNSRIPCSEHRTLSAMREWLRAHARTMRPQLTMSRLQPKTASPTRIPLFARSKGKVTEERKENAYAPVKAESERRRSPSVLAQRSGHDMVNMNMKYAKKNDPLKTTSRTRCLAENESKSKALSAKRRNVLAIRKPSTSKTQVGGVSKAKRDAEGSRALASAKLPRHYARSLRGAVTRSANRCRAMASSSSEDVVSGTWEDVAGGTVLGSAGGISHPETAAMGSKRRSFPASSSAHLKKIRLKTAL